MRTIKRKDLVVGVEYTLDNISGSKAHFVGRNELEEVLYFISYNKTIYFEDREGFILFDTSGDSFFLES